jgi:hypothetical protein
MNSMGTEVHITEKSGSSDSIYFGHNGRQIDQSDEIDNKDKTNQNRRVYRCENV